MDFLVLPTLTGSLATLEPLVPKHAGELAEAVAAGDLYQVWYTRLTPPGGMGAEIQHRLAWNTLPSGGRPGVPPATAVRRER